MSKIDDSTRLRHMLQAATEACEMISEESRASLDSDRKLIQVAYDRVPHITLKSIAHP
jgi:RPA family protein